MIQLFKYPILLGSIVTILGNCTVQPSTVKKNTTKITNIGEKPINNTTAKTKNSNTKMANLPQKNVENKTTKNNISTKEKNKIQLPTVKREFRGVWIASVANINWPSKGNITTEGQKAEAIRLLDILKKAKFNAVIFQVRPSADALYKSNYEPWSYFLTGQTGKAPSPYYDPLEFWIEEAHKRGLELHVWLNPYRTHHTSGGTVNSESMVNKMKNKVVRLKNGMYWMDPADESVQNHVSNVVNDIVKRYDIDAIHIDDYFYPYKEYNGGADFPDHQSWAKYKNQGGTLSRPDWRRGNINKFIKRLHTEIKQEKPFVKFGISPFGIWKPNHPEGIKGSSQYDELFADAKLWLNEGWCDYFSPQLYWKEGGSQSFSELLKWWQQENYKQIHLWPGLNTVGVKGVADKSEEIALQIDLTRKIVPKSPGVVHYSMDGLIKNTTMLQKISQKYAHDALPPISPWIQTIAMNPPKYNVQNIGKEYKISFYDDRDTFKRVVYYQYGKHWNYQILDLDTKTISYPKEKNGEKLNNIAVKKVNRLSEESDAIFWTP